jgi:hypothetical protein
MHGCHAIPPRLDDGDLYIGIRGGCGQGFLSEEHDRCCGVNEGGLI